MVPLEGVLKRDAMTRSERRTNWVGKTGGFGPYLLEGRSHAWAPPGQSVGIGDPER